MVADVVTSHALQATAELSHLRRTMLQCSKLQYIARKRRGLVWSGYIRPSTYMYNQPRLDLDLQCLYVCRPCWRNVLQECVLRNPILHECVNLSFTEPTVIAGLPIGLL